VVIFGLTLNWEIEETMPEIQTARKHWWTVFSFVANTCIFAINACGMANNLRSLGPRFLSSYRLILYPVMLYVALLAIRLLVMLLFMLPFHHIGYRMSMRDGVVVAFAWLKGDMALTIAFMLGDDLQMERNFGEHRMNLVRYTHLQLKFY
jgi:hypothetical protein